MFQFSNRVNSARGLWIENDFKIANTNNSVLLYNNLHIAKENLLNYQFWNRLGLMKQHLKNLL